MPRPRFLNYRSPLRPASLPPSGLALHSPQANQTQSLPSPAASKPKGLPLRPIRSKPLCTRAAAQPDPARPRGRFARSVALDVAARAAAENTHICVICPVAVIPPHREIYLLGQSAHRENKKLGISATFLRLRTLPCPSKAKIGAFTRQITCVFVPQFAIGELAAIANRKKVAIRTDFLFLDSWNSFDTVIWSGRAYAASQSALQRGPSVAS